MPHIKDSALAPVKASLIGIFLIALWPVTKGVKEPLMHVGYCEYGLFRLMEVGLFFLLVDGCRKEQTGSIGLHTHRPPTQVADLLGFP